MLPFHLVLQLSVRFPQSSALSKMTDMPSPSSVLSLSEAAELEVAARDGATLDVINPSLDYVPPELVSLLITDS